MNYLVLGSLFHYKNYIFTININFLRLFMTYLSFSLTFKVVFVLSWQIVGNYQKPIGYFLICETLYKSTISSICTVHTAGPSTGSLNYHCFIRSRVEAAPPTSNPVERSIPPATPSEISSSRRMTSTGSRRRMAHSRSQAIEVTGYWIEVTC